MIKPCLLIASALLWTACSSSPPTTTTSGPKSIPLVEGNFTLPSNGQTISLTIGKTLSDIPEAIEEPQEIFKLRQATSSFYSYQGQKIAESSITWKGQGIDIQHEPSSGKILITENTSDALPCIRYILLTPRRRS